MVLSSDKRDFYNFIPPLDDEMYELFVRFFWLIKADEVSKAKKLLREARRSWGLEPRPLHAHSYGKLLEPRGGSEFLAPIVLSQSPSHGGQISGFEAVVATTSTRSPGVSTTAKQLKLPASLRRKQNVSKPTPSMITKRQGAARTSLKKGKLVPKAGTTARGSNPAADRNEGSRIVSDKGE